MGAFFEKNWFKLAVAVILLAMIGSFGYKLWFTSDPVKDDHLKAMKPTPAFELLDLDGKVVNSEELDSKVRLYYFFFSSCPDVCRPTTFMLSKIQDSLKEKGYLGDKSEIVSITMDPSRDTPEVLKEYAESFHAEPGGWRFLRGEEKQIADLAEQFGVMIVKDKDGNFTHSNAILIADPKGVLRTYYTVDPEMDTEFIVKDVITLSKEK
ncbi:SCO family protein [Paenibacillus eucommiae]|uniref:Protein SCO1/2 n=1 Tax=Paenibacillus eucommiae TaxID=1355755 RepID=A0ABS4IWU5_9BACL|nr:SCO family protein [Paenibacillus eucommiae]MBP1992042.1 protein SCO1/2 [Paenibacillus eucommiae]